MIRTARAFWKGSLKEGTGTLSTQSGILDETKYSFKARFEEGENGTNPEELIAAAHAGCFTMAVCAGLTKKGLDPLSLDTRSTLTMGGLEITGIHLSINGSVKNITPAEFIAVTEDAAENCVVSKALSVKITSEAHLAE